MEKLTIYSLGNIRLKVYNQPPQAGYSQDVFTIENGKQTVTISEADAQDLCHMLMKHLQY
jgi:hypothetical protein